MSDPVRPTELTCDDVREAAGSFVLGALPDDEAAAVRAHLASCSDPHPEIAELGSILPVLDASVPQMEPSAALKGRVLAAAAAERPAVAPVAPEPVVSAALPEAPIPFPAARPRTSTLGWVMRIAAVVAIVALAGWNLLLQGQLTDSQQYEQNVAAVLDTARQPGAVAAILSPDGGTGSGIAAITATGDITMAMHDLAATTGDQVYEAWVIGSDGVPIPLGSFQVGRGGTAFLDAEAVPASDGLVLALTLEPAAGATTPTMPIISKGVATSAG
jgi:anti-sigma-K factor RskA